MSNTEKSLEKAAAIFDKLPLDEAIEVYHELGRKIHNRIAAKGVLDACLEHNKLFLQKVGIVDVSA